MEDSLINYLERASKVGGVVAGKFSDHKVAYFENNWISLSKARPNSSSARFEITEEGKAALKRMKGG